MRRDARWLSPAPQNATNRVRPRCSELRLGLISRIPNGLAPTKPEPCGTVVPNSLRPCKEVGVAHDGTARLETLRVAERPRDGIIDGRLALGSRLVERDLAAYFGVSRVPIREALVQLAFEGIITTVPRAPSTVRVFSASSIADLNGFRAAFEIAKVEIASVRHTSEGLDRPEFAARHSDGLAETGDATGAHRVAISFHTTVIKLSGNHTLGEIARTLDFRLRWLLSPHDVVELVAAEHTQLFDAIAARKRALVPIWQLDTLATAVVCRTTFYDVSLGHGPPGLGDRFSEPCLTGSRVTRLGLATPARNPSQHLPLHPLGLPKIRRITHRSNHANHHR